MKHRVQITWKHKTSAQQAKRKCMEEVVKHHKKLPASKPSGNINANEDIPYTSFKYQVEPDGTGHYIGIQHEGHIQK